ncbi:hypothetical protein [Vibrio parahaemolyticus]|uniref:hypothetical protein n=1 Tax=Vibrio parahaemolyticus TaxID=670 RepID=UPI0015DEE741|nr:hypothetical protein [Vibrio parahaemolyticus]
MDKGKYTTTNKEIEELKLYNKYLETFFNTDRCHETPFSMEKFYQYVDINLPVDEEE